MSIEDAIEKGLTKLGQRIVDGFFKNVDAQMAARVKLEEQKLKLIEKEIDRAARPAARPKKAPEKPKQRDQLAVAYDFLGVRPTDSLELAKSVYRAKAKHLHPDKKTGDKAAFQKLEAAFKLVQDDLRKRGK